MKSGIWDHESYPILEYGKRENMKLGTWNQVILKFELGNLQDPSGSPDQYDVLLTVFDGLREKESLVLLRTETFIFELTCTFCCTFTTTLFFCLSMNGPGDVKYQRRAEGALSLSSWSYQGLSSCGPRAWIVRVRSASSSSSCTVSGKKRGPVGLE